jgi:hypothetical protein
MELLIGIDDTDNKESRGTGYLSRQLARQIEGKGLGTVKGITRHQLFVHETIAYTSQNSAACLEVESEREKELSRFCAMYLKQQAADGSDAGLCVASRQHIAQEIARWGEQAKNTVLKLTDAVSLAAAHKIYLEGFTGSRIGQIGALAAVGLRWSGNDGRFIWLDGARELRDFDSGIYTVNELVWEAGIDLVRAIDGDIVPGNQKVFCDGWTRPILMDHLAVLLVEKANFADYGWKTIAKEHIRSIS